MECQSHKEYVRSSPIKRVAHPSLFKRGHMVNLVKKKT
jgi:hypothetical protein